MGKYQKENFRDIKLGSITAEINCVQNSNPGTSPPGQTNHLNLENNRWKFQTWNSTVPYSVVWQSTLGWSERSSLFVQASLWQDCVFLMVLNIILILYLRFSLLQFLSVPVFNMWCVSFFVNEMPEFFLWCSWGKQWGRFSCEGEGFPRVFEKDNLAFACHSIEIFKNWKCNRWVILTVFPS